MAASKRTSGPPRIVFGKVVGANPIKKKARKKRAKRAKRAKRSKAKRTTAAAPAAKPRKARKARKSRKARKKSLRTHPKVRNTDQAPAKESPKMAKKTRKRSKRRKAHRTTKAAAPAKKVRRRRRHHRRAEDRHRGPKGFKTGRFVAKRSSGGKRTRLTVKRGRRGKFVNKRSKRAGRGHTESFTVKRNPRSIAGAVFASAILGGLGFFGGTMLDRWLATRPPTGQTEPLSGQNAAAAIGLYSWRRFVAVEGLGLALVGAGMYGVKKAGMLRTALVAGGLGAAVKGGLDLVVKVVAPKLVGTGAFAQRYFPDEVFIASVMDAQGGMVWGVRDRQLRALAGRGATGCTGCGSGCDCPNCRNQRETDIASKLARMNNLNTPSLTSSGLRPEQTQTATASPSGNVVPIQATMTPISRPAVSAPR